MPASEFWLLLAFGLLMVAAFYVPALRGRSRERTRQRERLERERLERERLEREAGQTSTGTSLAERAAPEVEAPDVVAPPEKIAPSAPPAPAPAPPTPPSAPAPAGPAPAAPAPAAPEIETPAPTAGRLVRLRARLSKSQNLFGKGLLALLSRDKLDEETWEEIEETLQELREGTFVTT